MHGKLICNANQLGQLMNVNEWCTPLVTELYLIALKKINFFAKYLLHTIKIFLM